MIINQKKEVQLEAIFQQLDKASDCKVKQETLKSKVSNLVLLALQDDKKQIDCWDAFARLSWSKAF